MIRLLLLFFLMAGGNAWIFDCSSNKCGRPFNASKVDTSTTRIEFYQNPGFGPQNIVGTFHDGVTVLNFDFNDLTSFDGSNLANSKITTL